MMTAFRQRPAASAAALLVALGASSAQAAVTAQEVWDDWRSSIDMMGEGMVTVGSESLAGGVLTVTDLAFASTGEDGTTVTATVPQITFTENGDGTVAVSMSEEVPVAIASPASAETGAPATDVTLALTQRGLATTVSGEPGALTYDSSAARIALELRSVTQGGTALPAEAQLALNDVSSSTTSTTAELRDLAYAFSAASLDLLLDVTNPDDGSRVAISGQLQDMAAEADIAVPLTASESPDTALMDGLAVAGSYSTGAGQYIFEVSDASGPTNGTLATGGSQVTFDLSREAVAYDATASGVQLDATSAQMPFPVSVSIAEYGLNALIPATRSDQPQDWALGVNLTDLALNEEVWGLLDPQGMLDHGPATAILDLSGTATLFFDLFDPAQEEAMAAAPVPGQLDSIAINDLNLAVGGAQVTGTGSFTLDNADTTTFPGIPKPTGVAEFQLSGVNGLIDDLVAMGLIPQEQVMGARMVLGLLAVPGEGEDQLTSRIEVTADGQLLANGQRLQ